MSLDQLPEPGPAREIGDGALLEPAAAGDGAAAVAAGDGAAAAETAAASEPDADASEPDAEAGALGDFLNGGPLPVPACPLEFVDVVLALPSPNPVVILRETDYPGRQLHIPVGMAEGQAIAYAARGIATPKPLTHELFVDALAALGASVDVVRITNVVGNAFWAEIVLSSPSGVSTLHCRPSDGICLALRSPMAVPITAAAHELEDAGIDTETGG